MAQRELAIVPETVEVVTYARYSTDRQNERSIADQQRLCGETCKRLGLPAPTRHFADAARSGASLARRDGLRALLGYAAQPATRGVQRVLVVEALDRLGRNIYDSFDVVRRLHREAGMRIITTDGRDSESPAFKAMLLADSFVADVFLDNLRTHIRRGLAARMAEGKWVHRVPLGYKLRDGYLVIDEETAPQVRREFAIAASGLGPLAIARQMTRDGWTVTCRGIRARLHNRIYRGDVCWRGEVLRHDENLRLVTDSVWHRTQAILGERAAAFRRQAANPNLLRGGVGRAPLSGLLRCNECGKPLAVQTSKSSEPQYGCAGVRWGTCQLGLLSGRKLEDAVVRSVIDALVDERATEYIVRRVAGFLEAASASKAVEVRRLQRALRDAETRLRRCVAFVEQGETASVRDRIRELEAERATLRERLAKLQPPPKVTVLRSTILGYLARTVDLLREAPREQLRAALARVVADGQVARCAAGWRVSFTVTPVGLVREVLVPSGSISGTKLSNRYTGWPYTRSHSDGRLRAIRPSRCDARCGTCTHGRMRKRPL